MSVDKDGRVVLEESERTKYIWILFKWNGHAVVYPSPAILKVGTQVHIVNKTRAQADVTFPPGFMDSDKLSIDPKCSKPATAMKVSDYLEYDVSFKSADPPFYAEGGSKPGVIIEH